MIYADTDRHLSVLTYRSLTTSAVVQLRVERPQLRYERFRWWFSFGTRLEFGPYKSKMAAMLDAAHAVGKSGNGASWHPA